MTQRKRPGPTGRYPQGKLRADDCGELNVAMAADRAQQLVYINFATPVIWIAASPEDCRAFAAGLIRKADEVEGKTS
jgi:hypothetical protein